jgi:hypothetical protein
MKSTLLVIGLLVLAGCAEQLTQEEQDFKTVCEAHKNSFMKMNSMQDGKVLGEPCYGCMADEGTHICDKNEYLKYLAKEA